MKPRILTSSWLTAAALLAGLALPPVTQANDWIGGAGYWNDAANWNGGVPDDSGGWAIGNISNGGIAIVSNTVPNVSEAWAGNFGGAGTIIVTNGGVLNVDNWLVVARMCCPSPTVTPWSDLIVNGGTVNKRGDGFIIGDAGGGQGGLGRITVAGTAQVNVTGGWFSLGVGEGTAIGYFQDNSVYTSPAQDFNVADTGIAKATCYLKDNAAVNISRFFLGKGGNTVGALWQSGGAMNGTGTAPNEWTFGGDLSGDVNAFGFYNLSAGTLNCPYNFQVGRYGKGILYQSGGTNIQAGWCDTARFAGSLGVTWISGGLFQHTGTGTRYMVGENGRGEVTLSGTGVLETAAPLMMANGTSFLNLNGGTLLVPEIGKWGGQAYLSLNGGTIKAKASNPSFISATLTEARIYSGNAIFDTAGNDITISQTLLDGTGTGVLSIPITDGGAGYMAPPIVQITTDGNAAQAVAQIDPVAGTLTNIVIVCPGYGYGSPSVTLIGGGPTTPATLGTPTVGPVLGGGLIKNGAGTLILAAANQYTGPTVVNAGKLAVTTEPSGMGAYTVANAAVLGVKLTAPGGQLNVSSLTLASTTLDIDLGAFGNPSLAPIRVAGNLAVNGTIALNVADALPQIGQFPLIEYTTRSGAGSFVLGPLPTGVQGILVDNTTSKTVDLKITSVGLPRWDGQAGGNWDVDITTNWTELSTGLPTKFKDGSPALLDDAAIGTTTVNLVTTVQPAGVTVNNSTLDYTFVGTGKISGSQGLTKQGSAILTIATANDYTGPTVISGGKVIVTNLANGGLASAIGKSSSAATNLVLANGRLSYAGQATTIDRGYSVQATNSTIETVSDLGISGLTAGTAGSAFVKAGAGRLTYFGAGTKELSGGGSGGAPAYNIAAGTVIFDGTGGGQINHNQGELWVGGTPDTAAALILTNTALNIDSWLAVGRGNGSVGNVSTATLNNSALRSGNFSMGFDGGLAGNLVSPALTLNGTSTFTNNGDVNLGESGGAFASMFLNGISKFYSNWRLFIGWHANATGSVTMAQSSAMAVNAWLSIGNEGGVGTLTMKDNSSLWVLWDLNVTDVGTGDGTVNLQDNATATANNFFVGKGVGSSGLVNQTGGSAIGRLNDGNEFQIGFHGPGTWNMSAGSIVAPNHWFIVGRYADGPGILNVSAGTIIHGTNNTGKLFRVGEEGTGVLNLSGTGDIQSYGDAVTVGPFAGADGTINLNSGSFLARRIIGGVGASTINFNGGTLKAGPNANVNFLTNLTSANVLAGGAVIDSGPNNIAIAQALLAGSPSGGLTKFGPGALYLNGANTYTGQTLVNAGTLGGSGSIASPVVVGASGTLAPGTSVGTLTINNSLTLNGTTVMEVSKDGGVATSDLAAVTGNLQFGGVLNVVINSTNALAVNDAFNLFDWGTRSGSFTTVNLPAGYSWDTSQLTVDGTIKVTAVLASPTIKPPTVSGGNLILTGTGGTAGGGYTWLTATNVAAPAAEWTTNTTGTFDGTGAFSNAIPVSASEKARFFRMRVP